MQTNCEWGVSRHIFGNEQEGKPHTLLERKSNINVEISSHARSPSHVRFCSVSKHYESFN